MMQGYRQAKKARRIWISSVSANVRFQSQKPATDDRYYIASKPKLFTLFFLLQAPQGASYNLSPQDYNLGTNSFGGIWIHSPRNLNDAMNDLSDKD
jgi:hypothetical protein